MDNEIKQMKLLQNDCDKLQAAYTPSQKKFSAELDAEKQKNKILH